MASTTTTTTTPNNPAWFEQINPKLFCGGATIPERTQTQPELFAKEKIILKTIPAKKKKVTSLAMKVLNDDDNNDHVKKKNPIPFEELNQLLALVQLQQQPIKKNNNNDDDEVNNNNNNNHAHVEHMHPILFRMISLSHIVKPHENFINDRITLKSRTKKQSPKGVVSPIINLLTTESSKEETPENNSNNGIDDASVDDEQKETLLPPAKSSKSSKQQPSSDQKSKKEEEIQLEKEKKKEKKKEIEIEIEKKDVELLSTDNINPVLLEEMNPILNQIGIPSTTSYNVKVPAEKSSNIVVINETFSNERISSSSTSSHPGLLNPDGKINIIKSNPILLEEMNLKLIAAAVIAVAVAPAEEKEEEGNEVSSMEVVKTHQPILLEEEKSKIKEEKRVQTTTTAEKGQQDEHVAITTTKQKQQISVASVETVSENNVVHTTATASVVEEPASVRQQLTSNDLVDIPSKELSKVEVKEVALEPTKSNEPIILDKELLSEEQIVSRVEMISRNLIPVTDQTSPFVVEKKSAPMLEDPEHKRNEDSSEETLPSKEVEKKSIKGTILQEPVAVEERKEDEGKTPATQIEKLTSKEPMTFAKMVSREKSITSMEKQIVEEQVIIASKGVESQPKSSDNILSSSRNMYIGSPPGVEEAKFDDSVTNIPAPATFEELMGKTTTTTEGVMEETKFDDVVVTLQSNIPTPATFEELMPVKNAIVGITDLGLETPLMQPKNPPSSPAPFSYMAALRAKSTAKENVRKENRINNSFSNSAASPSIKKTKDASNKTSSSNGRVVQKNANSVFTTKNNKPTISNEKNLISKPMDRKKHSMVSKDTAGNEKVEETTVTANDVEDCSDKDSSVDFDEEDEEVFEEEIVIGEWSEIIGEELQMKIISSWTNEKQIACKPQDAVLVDFIGRLSPTKESNKEDDYDNKNDSEIFQNVQDWWITVGEKQVNPALEMGIRFLRTGQTAMIWSDSKYAFGPSDRIASSGYAKVPANANVSYAVTIRKIASQEELEDPAFQVQMARSNQLIANDIFAHEKSSSGQYRALAIFHKIAESMISLAYNTENAQEAREMLLDCLNNIVAVHLRMKEYKLAKESIDRVLLYDKTNTKGLIRAAKIAMLDPDGTCEEAQAAIDAAEKVIGPNHRDVKKLRIEMKEKNDNTKKVSVVAPPTETNNITPKKSKVTKKKKKKTNSISSSRGISENGAVVYDEQSKKSIFESKMFPTVVALTAVIVAANFFRRT